VTSSWFLIPQLAHCSFVSSITGNILRVVCFSRTYSAWSNHSYSKIYEAKDAICISGIGNVNNFYI